MIAEVIRDLLLSHGYSYFSYKDLNLMKEAAYELDIPVPDLTNTLKRKRFRDKFTAGLRRSTLFSMTYIREGNKLYVRYRLMCSGFSCKKRNKNGICTLNERSCYKVPLMECSYFMKHYKKAINKR